MKKLMHQFANTKDLLAGYAVGNVNGKLKEMVYADHILFCEEEVLREVITHIVIAFAKATETDYERIITWIQEADYERIITWIQEADYENINPVFVDLSLPKEVN